MTDLDRMVEDARYRVVLVAPEARAEMIRLQRESWAIAEAEFKSDVLLQPFVVYARIRHKGRLTWFEASVLASQFARNVAEGREWAIKVWLPQPRLRGTRQEGRVSIIYVAAGSGQ